MSALEIRALTTGYGGPPVLSDLSLSITPGRTTIMIGHNGAGSFTLARAIIGTLPTSRGEIWFEGEPVHRLSVANRLKKGMVLVLQDRAVFSDLTVADNLRFARLQVGKGRRSEKSDFEWAWQAFPPLRDAHARSASSLSGGQQRMLAIAMGIMTKPRLLVLDEPSLGLSPRLVQEVMEQIHAICNELGVTVLLIEQNVDAALNIAQDVVALRSGTLIHSGPSSGVRDPKALLALL